MSWWAARRSGGRYRFAVYFECEGREEQARVIAGVGLELKAGYYVVPVNSTAIEPAALPRGARPQILLGGRQAVSLVWGGEERNAVRYSTATLRTLARWHARFWWYHCADLILSLVAIELWILAFAGILTRR